MKSKRTKLVEEDAPCYISPEYLPDDNHTDEQWTNAYREGYEIEGDVTIGKIVFDDGEEYYSLNICDTWTLISKSMYNKMKNL